MGWYNFLAMGLKHAYDNPQNHQDKWRNEGRSFVLGA